MARDATIRYIGDSKSAERAARRVAEANEKLERQVGGVHKRLTKGFSSVGSSFAKTGRTILRAGTVAAAGGIAALGVGLVGAFKAAQESLKVGRQTEQVIKTMGASSWTSSKQIGLFSERLAQLTGVDDEIIQQGANLILTFKNIQDRVGKGNDVFSRTVTLANDMSVALGQDMKSSSIQLGKALNDPIKGVTALRRVGVSFTEAQIKQIKVLTESGDLLGAQKLILKEVESQFGGTAKAVATPWDRLKVTFGNIQEAIGMRLMPIIDRVVFFFNNLWPRALKVAKQAFDAFTAGFRNPDLESGRGIFRIAQELGQAAAKAWPHVQRIGEVLADVSKAVVDFFKKNPAVAFTALGVVIGTVLLSAIVAVGAAILAVLSPFVLVTAAVAALAAGVVYAYTRWSWFRKAVEAVISWFSSSAIPAVKDFASSVSETFRGIAEAVTHAVNVIVDVVKAVLITISAAWRTFGDDLMRYVSGIWEIIAGIIKGFMGVIQGVIKVVIALINGDWGKAWNAIKDIFSSIWATIVGILKGILTTIKGVIGAALEVVKGIWAAGLDAVWETIKSWWGTVREFFGNIPGAVKGFFSKAIDWLKEGGRNIIRGLWQGIKDIWNDVKDWFLAIPGKIADWLGIDSPPEWAIGFGKDIGQGVFEGLKSKVGDIGGLIKGLTSGVSGESARSNRMLGQQIAQLAGWTGSQWTALDKLVMSESGWNNTAQNPTSSAYGIGQFLDSTWAGTGYSKTSDPTTQIRAMLAYIGQRYGDPESAWSFKQAHNWYGTGGVVPGPIGAAKIIGAHGGEHIFTPGQMKALGGRRGMNVNITIDNRGSLNPNSPEIARLVTSGLKQAGELGMPITIRGRNL